MSKFGNDVKFVNRRNLGRFKCPICLGKWETREQAKSCELRHDSDVR